MATSSSSADVVASVAASAQKRSLEESDEDWHPPAPESEPTQKLSLDESDEDWQPPAAEVDDTHDVDLTTKKKPRLCGNPWCRKPGHNKQKCPQKESPAGWAPPAKTRKPRAKKGLKKESKGYPRAPEAWQLGGQPCRVLLVALDVEHTGYGCWKSWLLQVAAVACTMEIKTAGAAPEFTVPLSLNFDRNVHIPQDEFKLSSHVPAAVKEAFPRSKVTKLSSATRPPAEVIDELFKAIRNAKDATGKVLSI